MARADKMSEDRKAVIAKIRAKKNARRKKRRAENKAKKEKAAA